MKNATLAQKRLALWIHAAAFCVGIVVMLIVNLMIGQPYWIHWVVLGWGVGLISHWASVRFGRQGTAATHRQ